MTINMSGASSLSSAVTSTDGTTVEITRMSESSSSVPTMIAASTFNHGRLIHGPRPARPLHSRTATTVALGSTMPASSSTSGVSRPKGACGLPRAAAAIQPSPAQGRLAALPLGEHSERYARGTQVDFWETHPEGCPGGPNGAEDERGSIGGAPP